MSGINWRSYFFSYGWWRAKQLALHACLGMPVSHSSALQLLVGPREFCQLALEEEHHHGLAQGAEEQVSATPLDHTTAAWSTHGEEHQRKPLGRHSTTAAMEVLELSWAVQQENWDSLGIGQEMVAEAHGLEHQNHWVGIAIACLTHKLPPSKAAFKLFSSLGSCCAGLQNGSAYALWIC